jgi:hypothetical protein
MFYFLLAFSAVPQPAWPHSFISNFTENFKADSFSKNSTGFYALDLGFDGGKGAQRSTAATGRTQTAASSTLAPRARSSP